MEFLQYAAGAFLGGVLLNIMPCVLPVLTLKVFHSIEAFGDPNQNPRLHGALYAAGTTSSFLLFAVGLVMLRASGELMGWGMHFQHPPFVATLTGLIFVFGLNALGVFEITISSRGHDRKGYAGSFANGVFAAVMSTPCTAPFLATAAGFALAADTAAWETLVLFAIIGIGLAFPYTLIGFFPRLAGFLPQPGRWMETFKHLMGFTLLGTAVWLFGALQVQVTPAASKWFLVFLLIVAMGLWALGRFGGPAATNRRRWLVRGMVSLLVVYAALELVTLERAEARRPIVVSGGVDRAPIIKDGSIFWREFSPGQIEAEGEAHRAVFVDYTADWCAACKTNEQMFLETDTVRGALVETNTLPMKADMTNEDEVIESWLGRLRRDGKPFTGIPAYAIYLPGGAVEVLPVTITADLVARRLREASRRILAARNALP